MFHRSPAGVALGATLALLVLTSGALRAQTEPSGASTISGASRAFNPALSLNGLFLGAFSDRGDEAEAEAETDGEHAHAHAEEGLLVQEVELRLTADVDPYTRADGTLAFHDDEVHFEEIFVDSHALPWGLGLRAGRFYVPFSRENTLHTHQLPFVQRSLHQQALFEEGYADVGLEVYVARLVAELHGGQLAYDGDRWAWQFAVPALAPA